MSKKEKEDIEFEIAFYEGVIKDRPDFMEALAALGDLYTKKGWYEKGLKIDEKLAHVKPNDPIVLYNLACSYSLVEDLDKALVAIKEAIKCGYDDFCHLEEDEDLINLREDKRFKLYFDQLFQEKSGKKDKHD